MGKSGTAVQPMQESMRIQDEERHSQLQGDTELRVKEEYLHASRGRGRRRWAPAGGPSC